MTRRLLPLPLIAAFALACDGVTTSPEAELAPVTVPEAQFARGSSAAQLGGDAEASLIALGRQIEADMTARRPEARLAAIDYYGHGLEGQMGGRVEVFFEDRGNKQLPIQWVPGDPRRQGRTNIQWTALPNAPAGLTVEEVLGAYGRAMNTWATTTNCSDLPIVEVPLSDPTWDILHLGFFPLDELVLGATFIFIWIDIDTGEPTDIDGDGNFDYAFAFIVYQGDEEEAVWGIDTNVFPFVDVETVAFHEAGHGLAQEHFGAAFLTKNGKVHFSPRALMNASYSGLQHSLSGTDLAGHCSMWGSWPNN